MSAERVSAEAPFPLILLAALTPLGNWVKEAFNLSRNHYDRVGHIALGFFPVFILKEVLLLGRYHERSMAALVERTNLPA